MAFYPLFSLVGIAPLLFFLVDGYYMKNVKRGAYQILAFLCTMAFACLMIRIFKLYFALAFPFFLFVYVGFIKISSLTKRSGL